MTPNTPTPPSAEGNGDLRAGPSVHIKLSCHGCKHERSEYYAVQSDTGYRVFCDYFSPPQRIGDTTWNTPQWCPLRAQALASLINPEPRR